MQRVRPKDHVLHTNIGWNKVTNPPLHKVTEKQDSLAAYRSLSTQVSQACPSVIRSVRHNDCSSCNANNTVLKRCFLITLDESFHFCYQGAKKKKKKIYFGSTGWGHGSQVQSCIVRPSTPAKHIQMWRSEWWTGESKSSEQHLHSITYLHVYNQDPSLEVKPSVRQPSDFHQVS